MVKAHVDKEIIVSAVKKFMKDPLNNSRGFIDFLREGSDLVIYGKPNQSESSILMKFLEGRKDAMISPINQELSFSKHRVNQNNPYQVFFFNVSNAEKKTAIHTSHHFLYGFIDDYELTFNKLSKRSYHRVGDIESFFDFSSWSEVLPDLPVSEIIITDPFLVEENKGRNPLEENYFALLREIKRKYNIQSVLVFAPTTDKITRTELETESGKIMGNKVKFQLLPLKRNKEHDRYIFLNYVYIDSGSSFNNRNKDGEVDVSSTSKMTVNPLCYESHFLIAKDVLTTLHGELEKLKDKGSVLRSVNSGLFFCVQGGDQR